MILKMTAAGKGNSGAAAHLLENHAGGPCSDRRWVLLDDIGAHHAVGKFVPRLRQQSPIALIEIGLGKLWGAPLVFYFGFKILVFIRKHVI